MSSTPYDRQSSFAQFSAENPGRPHSGATLDAEFNAVKVAIDDTQQNLALIQDDDGALKRGSVGKEQFDSSVTIGFGAPTQWASGQIYTANVDTVFYQSVFYIANVTHTSGVSFEPDKWDLIADFTLAAVIPDNSITSAKLADGAVGANKIADGSISATKIATGAVSTAKIADSNVTTPKIADAAVTLPKLDPGVLPAGMIVPYAGASAPTGWLLCNGQSVLRADYPALFAAIGTTYGTADGTHFTLPDMRGRVPAGKDDMGGSAASRLTSANGGVDGASLGAAGGSQNVTLAANQIPSLTSSGSNSITVTSAGAHGSIPYDATTYSGNRTDGGGGGWVPAHGSPNAGAITSTGSNPISVVYPNGGQQATKVVQPTIVLNYIIKAH